MGLHTRLAQHLAFRDLMLNFFYSGKILTAIGPDDIFNLSGALPEQPQVSTSKTKMRLWSVALAERFLMAIHYAANLSYLTLSVVAQ